MPKPYFINPPRRKAKRRRTPKRGRDGKFMQSIRHKSGRKVTRRAWRAAGYRRNPIMAAPRRRRRRLPARSASGRFLKRGGGRRRRSFSLAPRRRRRRNPPLMRGIVGEGVRILLGGAGVTAGEIVNRQGVTLLKLDPNSPLGIAGQLGIALAAGIGAKRFLRLSGPFVDGLVYGAASAPFKAGLRMLAPAIATRLLDGGAGVETVAGWPEDGSGMGAYGLPAPSRDQAMLMGAYSTGVY